MGSSNFEDIRTWWTLQKRNIMHKHLHLVQWCYNWYSSKEHRPCRKVGLQNYFPLNLVVLNSQGQNVCWEDGKTIKTWGWIYSIAYPFKSYLSWWNRKNVVAEIPTIFAEISRHGKLLQNWWENHRICNGIIYEISMVIFKFANFSHHQRYPGIHVFIKQQVVTNPCCPPDLP